MGLGMRGVTLAGGVPPEKGKVSAGEKAGFFFDISVRVSNYRKRRSCATSRGDAVPVTECRDDSGRLPYR
jgi:hypothetical protein